MATLPLFGGCACGNIRYRVSVTPLDTGYCHCRLCQRTSGAPVLAWARVPIAEFRYLSGEPSIYRSSAWGERRFCPSCGTQVEFRLADKPEYVELNFVTLDEPDVIEPKMHIWCSSRLPWLELGDSLPRYDEEQP